jgi:Na+/melibiose symporter-like transporter
MPSAIETSPASRTSLWAGRILTALVVSFLLFDCTIKLMKLAPAVEGTVRLGYPVNLVAVIGIVLLACTALYVIPRTSILGAIFLTGYLGGAVASQLRIGEPLLSHVLFPIYFAALLWGGLYLREPRLRALFPLRS